MYCVTIVSRILSGTWPHERTASWNSMMLNLSPINTIWKAILRKLSIRDGNDLSMRKMEMDQMVQVGRMCSCILKSYIGVFTIEWRVLSVTHPAAVWPSGAARRTCGSRMCSSTPDPGCRYSGQSQPEYRRRSCTNAPAWTRCTARGSSYAMRDTINVSQRQYILSSGKVTDTGCGCIFYH